MPGMRARTCTLAFCLLFGCDETRTVEIRICSDAVIPAAGREYVVMDGEVTAIEPDGATPDDVDYDLEPQIDTVRILARDGEFEELNGGGRELDSGHQAPEKGFSLAIDFPTRDGTHFIEVEGLLRGVEVASFTRAVGKLDSLESIDMPLTKKCYGVSCGVGQTCITGGCRLAPGRKGGDDCAGVGP